MREALRLLGRDEEVLSFVDTLSVGPLVDVDQGAALRVAWWRCVDGQPAPPEKAVELDSDAWRRVRADERDVVLWHGHDPSERLFALRGCWQLRSQPGRVHEVKLATRTSVVLPLFYVAIFTVGSRVLADSWAECERVTDVAARAKRWERLRRRRGDWLRDLRGERITHLPVDAHDGALLDACTDADWTKSARIVGHVLAKYPICDAVAVWRVRELLARGSLEGRGTNNYLGLPEEVRPLQRDRDSLK